MIPVVSGMMDIIVGRLVMVVQRAMTTNRTIGVQAWDILIGVEVYQQARLMINVALVEVEVQQNFVLNVLQIHTKIS